jgi:glycosyltransferase involved in cell wall biosynthesis
LSKKKSLLIIGSVWVEPNSSAAGGRMLQLIELFFANDFEIIFASAAAESDFMIDFEDLGIKKLNIKLNDDGFDEVLKQINPQIVMFDRFMVEEQFGWRVTEICPKALRILDSEDLHFLRKARQNALKENRDVNVLDLQNDVAKREIASIYRCDLTLIISKFEMDLLMNTFNISQNILFYLPFLLNKISNEDISEKLKFIDRKNFIFIGNFYHEPNIDAVLFIKNNLWKSIKKELPNAEIEIYGAYMPQKILQLNNKKEGFLIMGRAKSAQKVIEKARVLLAPIRFGAGIKGKFSDAQFCGTPIVTTTIGAESMTSNNLWSGFIEDLDIELIKKSIYLYNNQEIWQQHQQSGYLIYNELYDKNNLIPNFLIRLNEVSKSLESHRTENFIGKMLLHHSLQSTKYLNKWIVEKNK